MAIIFLSHVGITGSHGFGSKHSDLKHMSQVDESAIKRTVAFLEMHRHESDETKIPNPILDEEIAFRNSYRTDPKGKHRTL
jgi:hypothetical protein